MNFEDIKEMTFEEAFDLWIARYQDSIDFPTLLEDLEKQGVIIIYD